ncbi:unnamed protein product [Lymnaea stagnalis]|uniref:TM7S3/TM198-like domain-containing protein n=1 Tax=Lymnaea stagnalis TaxID=6523 RepID=A0AAV2IQ74_LYMST
MWSVLPKALCSVLAVLSSLLTNGAGLVLESRIGKSTVVTIPANETTTAQLSVSVENISYVLIQFHCLSSNISLSTNATFPYDATKRGTDVGILTLSGKRQKTFTWYIHVEGFHDVTAVYYLDIHYADEPLPGGCNQVFNIPVDPSIVLKPGLHRTDVWFQLANMAVDQDQSFPNCESNMVLKNLTYDVYVYYLASRDLSQEEYFDGVQKMLSPNDILLYGQKIFSFSDGPTSKSTVAVTSQASQGAAYAVLVTRLDTGLKAAYVTAVTYSCGTGKEDCTTAITGGKIVLSIVFGSLGTFLLFFGHRFFKVTQVLVGYGFSSLLLYIVMSVPQTFEDSVKLPVALSLGIVGGCLWLAFWFLYPFPVMSVFLAGLVTGYLISSVLFITPLANVTWWVTTFNYAMGFVCVILLFAVVLMAFTKLLSILSCAVIGGYLFLMSVAIPLQSSLRLVFLNSVYHQTEENYLGVKVIFPFHTEDIILFTLWPPLVILGVVLQWHREKGRPAFDIPIWRGRTRSLEQVPQQYSENDEDEEENNTSSRGSDDERRWLLPARNPGYGSSAGRNVPGNPRNGRSKNKNMLT